MAGQRQRAKVVEHEKFRIVIMEVPSDDTVVSLIQELRELGVTDVVRTCPLTYDASKLEDAKIRVHEMLVPSGEMPSKETLARWRELICARYENPETAGVVGVHCVAGLGRAPVMAAVALMEVVRLTWMDAATKVRETKTGALNLKHMNFLRDYKLKMKASGTFGGGCRTIVLVAALGLVSALAVRALRGK